MRITVNGREYKVRLKAAAWPYMRLLSSAFTDPDVPSDRLEEAEQKVLKLCVAGEVHEDDADELLIKILAQFARIVGQEFRSFRPEVPDLGRGGG
jgi:hypothetical protein